MTSTGAASGSGDRGHDPGLVALLRVSAALATRNAERIRAALEEARESAPPEHVEEVLLQSCLFLGFPAALDGLGLWRQTVPELEEVPELGEVPELEASRGRERDRDVGRGDRLERGEEVCRRVYGDQYEALRGNIRRLHPEMERWMLEEGYGKVLGRPGLPLGKRELCIVAQLAVLDAPVQLYSHLRGALRTGATGAEVENALEIAEGLGSERAAAGAREAWERLRAARGAAVSERGADEG